MLVQMILGNLNNEMLILGIIIYDLNSWHIVLYADKMKKKKERKQYFLQAQCDPIQNGVSNGSKIGFPLELEKQSKRLFFFLKFVKD